MIIMNDFILWTSYIMGSLLFGLSLFALYPTSRYINKYLKTGDSELEGILLSTFNGNKNLGKSDSCFIFSGLSLFFIWLTAHYGLLYLTASILLYTLFIVYNIQQFKNLRDVFEYKKLL